MLSLSLVGHKNEAPKVLSAFEALFYVDIRFVLTYLRGFQLVRIFFQPERTKTAFNSGELCLILASIEFVYPNSDGLRRRNTYISIHSDDVPDIYSLIEKMKECGYTFTSEIRMIAKPKGVKNGCCISKLGFGYSYQMLMQRINNKHNEFVGRKKGRNRGDHSVCS